MHNDKSFFFFIPKDLVNLKPINANDFESPHTGTLINLKGDRKEQFLIHIHRYSDRGLRHASVGTMFPSNGTDKTIYFEIIRWIIITKLVSLELWLVGAGELITLVKMEMEGA